MLTTNELRIGNLLQDEKTGALLIVDSLTKEDIVLDVIGDKKPLPDGWQAKPIPLNKEWFERFGLDYPRGKIECTWTTLVILSTGVGNDRHYLCDQEGNEVRRLDYVHELQNVLYSITGLEIPYSINKTEF